MFFSQTAPRDDEHYEGDVAERDPDGGNSSFFRRTRIATDESDYDRRLRPGAGAPHHPPDLKSKQLTALRPSIASRGITHRCPLFLSDPDWCGRDACVAVLQ